MTHNTQAYNYGSINEPMVLEDALAPGRIQPGQTIYLRAGTYPGNYLSSLSGAMESPIVIKPYNNERVIIDGGLNSLGHFVHLYDLEIYFSGWVRRDEIPVDDPATHGGLILTGVGNKAIGCIIHDTDGTASWKNNWGGGYYECLIYNNGYLSPDRPHGPGIYTQNETPTQYHHRNIVCMNYGTGMQVYTQGESIQYFDIRDNILFQNERREIVLGGTGGQRMLYSVVDGNCMWEGDGYLRGTDITLTNNYSPNGFAIDEASQNITQSGNTFEAPASGVNVFVIPLTYKVGAHIAIFNWDLSDSVNVDLTTVTGLNVGDAYKLHNAQDYYVDIVEGTVPANKIIAVDMRAVSHSVAVRTGSTALATTFPNFGAFRLEKV